MVIDNIESIIEEWKEESKIDKFALDDDVVKASKLHAKYLEKHINSKLKLKILENQLADLRKDKWLYYGGKMTKEQLDENGWEYDPFKGGSKPLKGDMHIYYESDKDLQKIYDKITYQKSVIEVYEEIMASIRWRHTNIKNMIDFMKFNAGM